MTKQDYNLIAEAINEAGRLMPKQGHVPKTPREIASFIASCFSDRLTNTNPRFDADRFEDACINGL